MIMKKALFSLFLALCLSSFAFGNNQERQFKACVEKYKDVPQAYVEHVIGADISTKVPPEAELILKQVSSIIVGDKIYASIPIQTIMEHLVWKCMNEVRT